MSCVLQVLHFCCCYTITHHRALVSFFVRLCVCVCAAILCGMNMSSERIQQKESLVKERGRYWGRQEPQSENLGRSWGSRRLNFPLTHSASSRRYGLVHVLLSMCYAGHFILQDLTRAAAIVKFDALCRTTPCWVSACALLSCASQFCTRMHVVSELAAGVGGGRGARGVCPTRVSLQYVFRDLLM